jgi:hypothetical protein
VIPSSYSVNNGSLDKYTVANAKYSWYYKPTSKYIIFIPDSKIISSSCFTNWATVTESASD